MCELIILASTIILFGLTSVTFDSFVFDLVIKAHYIIISHSLQGSFYFLGFVIDGTDLYQEILLCFLYYFYEVLAMLS